MMNHDGSQHFAFGYGLASTPQIHLQQQQQPQIQLQQHFQSHHPQQLIQHHQGNSAIPAQNLFQLQVGGSHQTPALLQQNDATASCIAQGGLISQSVIHASCKPLQAVTAMDAMVYPQQDNRLKIIANSGTLVQQQQPQQEIHFQGVDSMGKNNMLDNIAAANQRSMVSAFGDQSLSGWVQTGREVGGQSVQPYSVGQNTLPSFGHLWSHFQQQKNQVNILPQQQQPQPSQIQQFHSPNHTGQTQQLSVSTFPTVNSIQMIQVHPNSNPPPQTAQILQPCPVQTLLHTPQKNNSALIQSSLSSSYSSSSSSSSSSSPLSLPQDAAASPVQFQPLLPKSQAPASKVTVSAANAKKTSGPSLNLPARNGVKAVVLSNSPAGKKACSKSMHVKRKSQSISSAPLGIAVSKDNLPNKLNSSQASVKKAPPLPSNTIRIKPSSEKALSESGPPKVTVTLDSLVSSLSKFPDKTVLPIEVAEKLGNLSPKDNLKLEKKQAFLWQHAHTGFHERAKLITPMNMSSSTGSSLDRPSSEDSNFSSPPYSLTPPNSIDSVFSPQPFSKLVPDTRTISSSHPSLSPTEEFTSSPPPLSTQQIVMPPASDIANTKTLFRPIDNSQSLLEMSAASSSSSLALASCCSVAITTTSVTSSMPTTQGEIAVSASIHSNTPLSSPSSSSTRTKSQRLRNVSSQSNVCQPQIVKVPYSWERKVEDAAVVYISPSGAVLTSLDEVCQYLMSQDTCKCGLECPFQLEDTFVFDPQVDSQPWAVGVDGSDKSSLANLCNHRREVVAMAAFHQSQTQAGQLLSDSSNINRRKRDSRLSLPSSCDLLDSPLKKLKTSITNAVNRHASLHSNQPVRNASVTSSISELEATWTQDDVFCTPAPRTASISSESAISMPPYTGPEKFFGAVHDPRVIGSCEEGDWLYPSTDHPVASDSNTSQRDALCTDPRFGQMTRVEVLTSSSQSTLAERETSIPSSLQDFDFSPMKTSESRCDLAGSMQLNSAALFEKNAKPTVSFSAKMSSSNHKDYTTQGDFPKSRTDVIDSCRSSSASITSDLEKYGLSTSVSLSCMDNSAPLSLHPTVTVTNVLSSCQGQGSSPECEEQSRLLDQVYFRRNRGADKSSSILSEDDAEENLDTSREDEEDMEHKGSTDAESNKSFSDGTENNDSAYLSQAGSDQEKSDTVDGLDQMSKTSDVYDFNSSEDFVESMPVIGNRKASRGEETPEGTTDLVLEEGEKLSDSVTQKQNAARPNCVLKEAEITTASSPSPLPCLTSPPPGDNFSSLNVDLSQLLASNNWNIPSLQKVLAQHSAGDPERLRLAVQQVMHQITSPSESCYAPVSKQKIKAISNRVTKEGKKQQQAAKKSVPNQVGKNRAEVMLKSQKLVKGKPSPSSTLSNTLNLGVSSAVSSAKMCNQSSALKTLTNPKNLPSPQSTAIVKGTTVASSLNNGLARQPPLMNSSSSPIRLHASSSICTSTVSVNVITSVSTKPFTQVGIPTVNIDQGILPQTQQFLSPQSTHNLNGCSVTGQQQQQQQQLLTTNHLQQQQRQHVNAVSIPGLSSPLVLANPMPPQASLSSMTQLSPAPQMMIAQGHQAQMSPSFVSAGAAQIPKPCGHHNAAIPLANNAGSIDVSGSLPQAAKDLLTVISGSRAPLNHNATVNASVYSAGNQPVFVIPQGKPVQQPVVQLVGSNQTLGPAPALSGDVTSQILNQAALTDQNQQLQNLIAASGGFNPLAVPSATAWGTVNLNAQQQQQQQQLQLLQLQQLMLPVLQNHQSSALPACPSQPTNATNNALLNAVVAQQGLHLNQMVDVKAIQQNLSPAQGFTNATAATLSPLTQTPQASFASPLQPMASPLTVQVGSTVTANPNPHPPRQQPNGNNIQQSHIITSNQTSHNVLQPQKPIPITTNSIQTGQQPPSPCNGASLKSKLNDKPSSQDPQPSAQVEQVPVGGPHLASAGVAPAAKPQTAAKSGSKSKPKSKKSDVAKVKDPQAAKDEEHIAQAVNQLLAQAVQQQRELTLAAQNQPPPPPKSRSRKRDSQARARAALAKEQELGKIASISDDTVFPHPSTKLVIQPPPAGKQLGSTALSTSFSSLSPLQKDTRLVSSAPGFAISSSQPGGLLPPSALVKLPHSLSLPSPTTPSSLPPLSAPMRNRVSNAQSISSFPPQPDSVAVCSNTATSLTSPAPPISGNSFEKKSANLSTALEIKNYAPALPSLSQKKSVGLSLKEHLSSIVVCKEKVVSKKKGVTDLTCVSDVGHVTAPNVRSPSSLSSVHPPRNENQMSSSEPVVTKVAKMTL